MCSLSEKMPSPRIFISYAREDEDVAEELYQFLKSSGADPWLDKHQLVPGDAWKSEIKRAISNSDFFVACLRPEDDRRGFHHVEVRLALAEAECRPPDKAFIIPFIVKPCELPDWAHDIHAGADLTVPSKPIDILRAVDKNLGTSLAGRASETLVVSPGEKLVVPPPAGSAGQLLPFAALSEYQFQDFCCALLEKDPHVVSAEIYGVRGQSQRGIDLKGPIAAENGLAVGQCKRYEKISSSEVRSASDAFFDHLDFWMKRNIRRFVLFVSCRMDMTQLQDQIDEETERFSEAGIAYEVWHQRRLTEKACAAPQLVERFFHPFGREWLGVIGALPVSTGAFEGGTRHAMDVVHVSVVERLVEVSDQATEERLAQIRSLIEQGRVAIAHERLEVLKESSFWRTASSESRASVLRVEAGLLLQEEDKLNAAQLLADEARQLAPSADERTLRAMLGRVRFGPEAGLAELEGTPTLPVLNLRAQLQLEAGNPTACERTLEELMGVFEPDAETHRTRCLHALVQRNVDSAVQAAERAVEHQPSSAVARFTAAVAYIWSTIAPAALPLRLLALPPPIDSRFVLQDAISQQRLSIAAGYLDDLLEIDSGRAFGSDSLLAWKLACLAIASAGLDQARAICEEELELKSPSPSIVRWACARGWVTDLEQLGERLRSEYKTDDPEQVEIVVQCLLASGKPDAALQHLRLAKNEFSETGNDDAFHVLELECLYRLGDEKVVSDAVRRVEGTQAADPASLAIARSTYEATGDAVPLVKELERQWQTHSDPRLLLDLCELKAITRDWRFVVEHGEPLLRDVPTPAVLLLYVMALYNTGQYEACLECPVPERC